MPIHSTLNANAFESFIGFVEIQSRYCFKFLLLLCRVRHLLYIIYSLPDEKEEYFKFVNFNYPFFKSYSKIYQTCNFLQFYF